MRKIINNGQEKENRSKESKIYLITSLLAKQAYHIFDKRIQFTHCILCSKIYMMILCVCERAFAGDCEKTQTYHEEEQL